MKMVKSLLLGTAAGLVAMTGAQAADLPVKAKPVQYVKICSLYGAGFYYMPGTDTCLKVGGYVRAEYDFNAGGSFAVLANGVNAEHNRASDEFHSRVRGLVSFDARTQTEYGTLRSYISGGWQSDNGATAVSATAVNRFFVQLAGFTAGYTTSFFDFFNYGTYTNLTNAVGSDTSGSGITVFAYTAQFGNGLSASISAEEANTRRTRVFNDNAFGNSAAALTAFANTGPADQYAANRAPDLVGNIRLDQAWGGAQIMGALHNVSGLYFDATEDTGHPDDELGWAIGGGVKFNLPFLGQGDSISAQVTYAEGATGYNFTGLATSSTKGAGFNVYEGNTFGLGLLSDAVYSGATGGDLELTKSWSVSAGLDHHWTANLRSSIYGNYGKVEYNDAATAIIANAAANAGIVVSGQGNPDFAFWQVGSRTVWTPVANLDLSVDVIYNKLETGFDGSVLALTPAAPKPSANYAVSNQDWWAGIFRVQRNFYP